MYPCIRKPIHGDQIEEAPSRDNNVSGRIHLEFSRCNASLAGAKRLPARAGRRRKSHFTV